MALNAGNAMGPQPYVIPRSASPSCISLTASSSVPATMPDSPAGASQVELGIIPIPRYYTWSLEGTDSDWPGAAIRAVAHFQQSAGGAVPVAPNRDYDLLFLLLLLLHLLVLRRRGTCGHASPRCVLRPCSAFMLLKFHHRERNLIYALCGSMLPLHTMLCLPVLSGGEAWMELIEKFP